MSFIPFKKNTLLFLIPLVFILIVWTSFSYFSLTNSNAWINPDIAETLYTGKKLYNGNILYVDWLNVNPPLIYFISELAVVISKIVSKPDIVIYYALFFLTAITGYFILMYKLIDFNKVDNKKTFSNLLAYSAIVLGVSYTGFQEMAQREHWFLIIFLPYFVLKWINDESFLWIFFMGMAASMKPGFMLIIVLTEIIFLIKNKTIHFKNLIAFSSGLLIPFIILGVHSIDSLKAFFNWSLPTYTYYYIGYQEKWSILFDVLKDNLFLFLTPLIFVVFLTISIFLKKTKPALKEINSFIIILIIASFFNVIIQHKFWSHLFMPFFGISLFFLIIKTEEILGKWGSLIILISLTFWTYKGIKLSTLTGNYVNQTGRFSSLLTERKNVLLLTEDVTPIASAYFSKVNLIGPWVFLHTFGGILQEKNRLQKKALLKKLQSDIIGGIKKNDPELVLIDQNHILQGSSLGVLLEKRMSVITILKNIGYRQLTEEEINLCCSGNGNFLVFSKKK